MSAGAELEASAQRERELRKIVLAWLNKKGYTKAEEQFRLEAEIAGVVEKCVYCTIYVSSVVAEGGQRSVICIC